MGSRFARFLEKAKLLKRNLSKRVMEERRAEATMVFHHPRRGSPMEKIVPKGDSFHRFEACRCGELRERFLSAKIKFLAKEIHQFSTFLAIS